MFGDIINAVVKTITLPIDVVKDVVEATKKDGQIGHTADKVEDIIEDLF